MSIRSLIFASLFLSTNAFAWSVPLNQASYDPGPHTPGPIDCTYTNDDGQEFSGTITSDGSGGLLCSGYAIPNDDDIIEAELADRGIALEGEPGGIVDDGEGNFDVVLDQAIDTREEASFELTRF